MFNKTATKGMRDILPKELLFRESVLDTIKKVYRKFGFMQIETPCVEDINLLTSKQGGDNEKLIFKILKRGEKLETAETELCDLGLRYDLTVPLTRYYANNSGSLPSIFKAMQIGNVWRAERPQKGRFRQFVQCDIDIIGDETIFAEVELINATSTALRALGFKNFTVRINDRRILKAMALKSGFIETEFERVFIALDKLDKILVDGVRKELIELNYDIKKIDCFLNFVNDIVTNANPLEFCLQQLNKFLDKKLIDDISSIFAINTPLIKDYKLIFDPTLVRGMNYYTGAIFEVSIDGFGGSVAGGGRYDEMLGKFLNKSIPACGFSIGFERIISIMTERNMFNTNSVEKVAYIIDKNISDEALVLVMKKAEEIRGQDKVCLIEKKINNFGFQLKQLTEEGYTKQYIVSSNGEIREID